MSKLEESAKTYQLDVALRVSDQFEVTFQDLNSEVKFAFLAGWNAREQDAKKEVFDDIRSQLPGFHACPEWDQMYIWKGLPEMSACSCLERK